MPAAKRPRSIAARAARPAARPAPAEQHAALPPLPESEDPVALVTPQPVTCAECGTLCVRGDLVHYEAQKPLCLDCALLGKLVFLRSGDVALTRRAAKNSRTRAVVLEWVRGRKRYERRGTLVEREALLLAKIECEADAAQRSQQRAAAAVRREAEQKEYVAAFTAAVRHLFPRCPVSEAREIAAHACETSSGRVGRTAAAKELEPKTVVLAVIAHVRHLHTDYDSIIEKTRDKRGSRARIKDKVAAVLQEWSAAATSA